MIKVAILGSTGYGGGELLRWFCHRTDILGIQAVSRQLGGQKIAEHHRHLSHLIDDAFTDAVDWGAWQDCEAPVLFAAMPHGEFKKLWPEIRQNITHPNSTVIDLSADFRIQNKGLYETHYGSESPFPDDIDAWTYGLPELDHEQIQKARRIANPGCFATALQLALAPIASHIPKQQISIVGVTGSSGSGAKPSATTHHPTRANDFRAYKVLQHQHMAEVTQRFSDLDVAFVPCSGPFVRGIHLTVIAKADPSFNAMAAYESQYRHCSFIRRVHGQAHVLSVTGSNFVEIGVVQHGSQLAVTLTLDNLVKGMAGQAIQNMNLALGIDERSGLWLPANSPG